MTDKQFRFIMQSLRRRLLDSLHEKEFLCEVNPEHIDPDYRNRFVVDSEDIEFVFRTVFSEIMEDEDG